MRFVFIVAALGMFILQGALVSQAYEGEEAGYMLDTPVGEIREHDRNIEYGTCITRRNATECTPVPQVEYGRRVFTTSHARFMRMAPIHRNFGESWLDPSGLIWGDVAKNSDGTVRFMTLDEAMDHCLNMNPDPSDRARVRADLEAGREPERGIFLPTTWSFMRLRIYFGGNRFDDDSYTPQVLPNLTRVANGSVENILFWVSLPGHIDHDHSRKYFQGGDGLFAYDYGDGEGGGFLDGIAVRCVALADPAH